MPGFKITFLTALSVGATMASAWADNVQMTINAQTTSAPTKPGVVGTLVQNPTKYYPSLAEAQKYKLTGYKSNDGKVYVDMGNGRFGTVNEKYAKDCLAGTQYCIVEPVELQLRDGKTTRDVGSQENLKLLLNDPNHMAEIDRPEPAVVAAGTPAIPGTAAKVPGAAATKAGGDAAKAATPGEAAPEAPKFVEEVHGGKTYYRDLVTHELWDSKPSASRPVVGAQQGDAGGEIVRQRNPDPVVPLVVQENKVDAEGKVLGTEIKRDERDLSGAQFYGKTGSKGGFAWDEKTGEVYSKVDEDTWVANGKAESAEQAGARALSDREAKNLSRISKRTIQDDGWKPSDDVEGGECGYSKKLHLNCKSTKTFVKTAQITNQVTQAAAAAATSIGGQYINAKAQQESTQEAVMRAAATQSRMAGYTNLGLGGMNLGAGVAQSLMAMKHGKNAKTYQAAGVAVQGGSAGSSGNGRTSGEGYIGTTGAQQTIDHEFGLNERFNNSAGLTVSLSDPACAKGKELCQMTRDAQFKQKQGWFNTNLKKISNSTANEQSEVKDEATNGAVASTLSALPQLMTGTFAMLTAREYDKVANELRRQANTAPVTPGFDPAPANPADTPRNPFGEGTNSTATSKEDDVQPIDEGGPAEQQPGFDSGFGMDDGPNAGTTPPGVFQLGKPDNGQGGGNGGSSLAGGSTREANPDKEPAAKPITDENGRSFAQGEGQRGGMQNRGGGSSESSIDLSGILAKFLPEAEKDHTNNGKRFIAFEGDGALANGSLLGKEVNIFGRVHDAYQGKAKSGQVGI